MPGLAVRRMVFVEREGIGASPLGRIVVGGIWALSGSAGCSAPSCNWTAGRVGNPIEVSLRLQVRRELEMFAEPVRTKTWAMRWHLLRNARSVRRLLHGALVPEHRGQGSRLDARATARRTAARGLRYAPADCRFALLQR